MEQRSTRRGQSRAAAQCTTTLLIVAVAATSLAPSAAFPTFSWSQPKQPDQFGPDGIPIKRPLVISHGGNRGAYALYTLPSYEQALDDGVRTLECKVCITRDGIPMCCAGMNLEYVTDVKKYASRDLKGLYTDHFYFNDKEPRRDGWFIFNFTRQQLSTLKIVNDVRHPLLLVKARRSERKHYVPWTTVPTLAEFLDMVLSWAEKSPSIGQHQTGDATTAAVRALENMQGKDFTPINSRPTWDIRILLEPLYSEFMYTELGMESDKIILDVLSQYKLIPTHRPENETESTWEPPRVAVHLQSKEAKLLRLLHEQAPLLPLISVLDDDWDREDCPYPILPMTGDMALWRLAVWDDIRSYSWAVSLSKDLLLPRNDTNYLAVPPMTGGMPPGGEVMLRARERNLTVLCWSFCEDSLYPMAYDFNADPYAEHDAFVEGVGVDGFFTACPATSERYLESRTCLQLLAAGEKPITSEELTFTELLVMGFMIVVAVIPMAMGLLYAIYKWRESEQFRRWQEFNLAALTGGKKDATFMKDAMGPSAKEREKGSLMTEAGAPAKGKGKKSKSKKADVAPDAEDSASGSLQSSSGTWRMRKGAEWNSDDAWT